LRGKVAIANAKWWLIKLAKIFFLGPVGVTVPKARRRRGFCGFNRKLEYSDVFYIGITDWQDTVITIPPQTWDAFRDHGKLRNSLTEKNARSKGNSFEFRESRTSLEAATITTG